MKKIKGIFILAILVILLLLSGILYGSVIEYGEIGYTSAFFTDLFAKISSYVFVFLILTLALFLNYYLVSKNLEKSGDFLEFSSHKGKIKLLTFLIVVFSAFTIGNINYETILTFINKTPFGEVDALFGKDISFYIFTLPFYKLILGVLSFAVGAGTIYSAVLYFIFSLRGSISLIVEKERAAVHLITNALIFAAIKSFSLYIKRYEILYDEFSHGLTGAGMTDSVLWKGFYTFSPFFLFGLVILSILFLAKRKKKPFIISVVTYPVVYALFLVLSFAFQGLYVEPREVTAEAPYIVNNIEATKKAYRIDDIDERIFNISYDLTIEDIRKHPETVENIRITDNSANLTVANALQATRGYYSFLDMDILPYDIDGQKRGISTAVRELDTDRLDEGSKSYINTKMRYTHGYGVVMSNVNSVTEEGQPDYLVEDVPLKISKDELKINVPQIYFGEYTDDYAIVGTDYNELDYMREGASVETRYEGEGGIKLTPLNRLYYAVKEADWMMLFSGYINSESKILINRNIMERAEKIAPYLLYDSDPYIVINDEGRLIWVIDAYTVSNKYPYSQKYSSINYIRNSIKVTIDAYSGETNFYVTDKTDPIALTYQKIYPDVYKNHELPLDVASHIRYPEFFFKLQMEMYENYHVEDPETFYSRSDVWLTAQEKYNNSQEKDVEPYYNIMKLSGDGETDMVLMLPFIPKAKQNLIAWVGVSSNYDTYGEMVVYKFPEGSPVNGTLQIENLISSDPLISEQISLWDQGDSNVMKGNLLVIPIENSIIYVEPLYITSGVNSSIPQVKRILMAYGDKVVMAKDLSEAFTMLFGEGNIKEETEIIIPGVESENIAHIKDIFGEIKTAFANGNWTLFGQKMTELEKALGN